jgi:uncharacterized protein YlxW (UPF0749 family)
VASSRSESLARWRDLLRIRLSGRWRPAAVVMFVLAGLLFVTTSVNSKGLDLRAASITDLDHVVRAERAHANGLADRVADLNKEVGALSRGVGGTQVDELQREVDALRGPAGFTAVHGPGITVTLDDAPKEVIDEVTASGDVSAAELVVHQQDIQAVVNALWSGGAEAMTIQGQRVVSTTGIKCVGNTVVLHGVTYSPPYRISAIGNVGYLQAALDSSVWVQAYLTYVTKYQLGYDAAVDDDLDFPAYEGAASLTYAVPGEPDRPSRSS